MMIFCRYIVQSYFTVLLTVSLVSIGFLKVGKLRFSVVSCNLERTFDSNHLVKPFFYLFITLAECNPAHLPKKTQFRHIPLAIRRPFKHSCQSRAACQEGSTRRWEGPGRNYSHLPRHSRRARPWKGQKNNRRDQEMCVGIMERNTAHFEESHSLWSFSGTLLQGEQKNQGISSPEPNKPFCGARCPQSVVTAKSFFPRKTVNLPPLVFVQ